MQFGCTLHPVQFRNLILVRNASIAAITLLWHLIHLGHLALSGAAILHIEATAVLEDGRITQRDVGLYNNATEAAIGRVLDSIRQWSRIPIGIQLSHAGRKASAKVPWEGGGQIPCGSPLGWRTVAPSQIPYIEGDVPPVALTRGDLRTLRDAFADAAVRADRLGLDLIQIHAAHGYLLHQFLSPLSNHREDEYGGSLENRIRFPLEVFDAVRQAFSSTKPVSIRVSATGYRPSRSGSTSRCLLAESRKPIAVS